MFQTRAKIPKITAPQVSHRPQQKKGNTTPLCGGKKVTTPTKCLEATMGDKE